MVMGKKCFCTQDVSCHLRNAFAWFQFKPPSCFLMVMEHSDRTLHGAEMCTITKTTPSCFITMVTMLESTLETLPGATLSAIDIWEFFNDTT